MMEIYKRLSFKVNLIIMSREELYKARKKLLIKLLNGGKNIESKLKKGLI
jgi:hypothetical protein